MIKVNVYQFLDYPIHTSLFIMDFALLLVWSPPLLVALPLFGLLLWLTLFFALKCERSDRFSVVCVAPPAKPKPAAAAPTPAPAAKAEAPVVAAAHAEPAAAVAVAAAAAPAATPSKAAPAAAPEAKPAATTAPRRSTSTTRRSTHK
ncbi:MAG: hypothetical protein EPN21_05015 [Methylococcaceae bacterium]|nr:MAG: hypothetical protein EPN21_05015 [Methylococcaceae bacterium]